MTDKNQGTILPGRIGILGAGAIGLYYGALLQRAGMEVLFHTRTGAARLRADGLRVRQVAGEEFHLRKVSAFADTSEMGACDWVFVTLKATANQLLGQLLPPLLHAGSRVITLQNGMGNVEAIANATAREPLGAGLCFVCVNRLEEGVVENYLPGNIRFAPARGQSLEEISAVAAAFETAGVRAVCGNDLDLALWMKLCWNIPFNGLAIAGGGITTEQILARPDLEQRVEILMREVQAAAAAEGKVIADEHLAQQMQATRRMGAYRPSSLIDFQAGRPVEVDALWGTPWRRARDHGVETPELEKLYREVKAACGEASQ